MVNQRIGLALKGVIKRLLGFSGRKQVKILAGPARGVSMTLDLSVQTPLYLGMYEWELHRWLREVLPESRLIFDIGGYVGYDALMFAANTSGRVVTFEPNQVNRCLLEANLAQNPRLEQRITVSKVAIGRNDGNGNTTLDAISAELGVPDLIKIDIEGGERDALLGGLTTLRDAGPHVVVETHTLELENECGAFLAECGYRPIIKHNRRIWREYRGGLPHNRWLLATGRHRRA